MLGSNSTYFFIAMQRFCSWCFEKTSHSLAEKNLIRRNLYECQACKRRTLECIAPKCSHMARTGEYWDDNLCAEHDGAIASFERLSVKLSDVGDFETIFERDSFNYLKFGKIGAAVVGGVALVTPLAVVSGPAIASALGSAGVLGAAGSGTAISSLSGAALTSASMAAIGGGTMAGGTAVVTAVGAALGAAQGAAVSNSYFGEIEHFDIKKVHHGNKHGVIFVNGFLTEKNLDVKDWFQQLSPVFPKNTWYHMDWESKTLLKLGSYLASTPKVASMEMVKQLSTRAMKSAPKALGPLAVVTSLNHLIGNPWHASMIKAQLAGVMLADAIARTPGWRFTLVGHSLGARVIFFALEALSSKGKRSIENVYLLGGAVGGGKKDSPGWLSAAKSVKGYIYNCHSKRDSVLEYMYRGINGWQSDPIGFSPIQVQHERIHNFDCSELVDGHFCWKNNFSVIHRRLQLSETSTK
ncbi:hypothetical protein J2W30_004473 [Variovorax boronicumulans]|uniref:DUF726 domain-containing protein n=1 Tax=Variovorax boronicumulans TaxID=436515 RepID=UPI00277DD6B9|nr:DUF726 domain-containing protein [Variovorax boronicumulans]MDQ0036698.1 hypothetical protein [Variovorax boronicumulans]